MNKKIVAILTIVVAAGLITAFVFRDDLFGNDLVDQEARITDSQIDKSSSEFNESTVILDKNDDPDQVEQNRQPNNNSGGSDVQTVDVAITDASQYGDTVEVRAFVPEVVEKGKCVIEFRKDGLLVSVEETAQPDAASTVCFTSEISTAEFSSSGTWEVSVKYTSDSGNISGMAETEVVIL